jgi:hypothetical protein
MAVRVRRRLNIDYYDDLTMGLCKKIQVQIIHQVRMRCRIDVRRLFHDQDLPYRIPYRIKRLIAKGLK